MFIAALAVLFTISIKKESPPATCAAVPGVVNSYDLLSQFEDILVVPSVKICCVAPESVPSAGSEKVNALNTPPYPKAPDALMSYVTI